MPNTFPAQGPHHRGVNAEQVASWYLRLNGFLSIPCFVVHPDRVREFARTEADQIAVRFPYSYEVIAQRDMTDDSRLTRLASADQILFLLVEVKAGLCAINGPWTNRQQNNMQRVIRRMGFAAPEKIDDIADAMYSSLRWNDTRYTLQYISVGSRRDPALLDQYPHLVQVTWEEIADFLFDRFKAFPEKLPTTGRRVHSQWPNFGRFYGAAVQGVDSRAKSRALVAQYINQGSLSRRG